MARDRGAYKMSGNIEIEAGKLIDARSKVATKEDLADSQTWEDSNGISYLTSGQQVYVESEKKTYLYIGTDPDAYDDEDNWKLLGEGDVNTDIETDDSYGLKVFGDTTSEIRIGTNTKIYKEVNIGTAAIIGKEVRIGSQVYTAYNDPYNTEEYSLKIGTGYDNILLIGTGVEIKSGITIGTANIKYNGEVVCTFSTDQSSGGSSDITVSSDSSISIGSGNPHKVVFEHSGIYGYWNNSTRISIGAGSKLMDDAVYFNDGTIIGTKGVTRDGYTTSWNSILSGNGGGTSSSGSNDCNVTIEDNRILIGTETVVATTIGTDGLNIGTIIEIGARVSIKDGAYIGTDAEIDVYGISVGSGFKLGTEGLIINGQTIVSDWSNLGGDGGTSSGSTGGVSLNVTTADSGGVLSISHSSLNGIQLGDGLKIGTEGIQTNPFDSTKDIDIKPGLKIGTIPNDDQNYAHHRNFKIESFLGDAWSPVILGSGAELRPNAILGTNVQVSLNGESLELWNRSSENVQTKKAAIGNDVIRLGNLQITLTTESFKLKNLSNNFEIELGVGALAKTQAQYDAIDIKDDNTLYYIKDGGSDNATLTDEIYNEESYEDW